MNVTSHNLPACVAWSNCSIGEYESAPGTHLLDRTCSPCPVGQFRDSDNHFFTFCVDWTQCGVGEYRVSGTGNTTSNVQCSQCNPGTFNNLTTHLNEFCFDCPADEKASQFGSPSCSSHVECNEGLASPIYRVLVQGNSTHDPICLKCELPGRRHLADFSASEAGDPCRECPTSTFNSVNPVSFPVSQSTADQSTTCTSMQNCSFGEFSAYNNVDVNQTLDRVCSPCGPLDFMNETQHTHTSCFPRTQCDSGFFESVVGTPSSDTVCTALSLCGPGHFANDEVIVPWIDQNRVCAQCPDGKFMSDNNHALKVCNDWRECSINERYVSGTESSTRDRTCEPCPAGSGVPHDSHLNTSCTSAATAESGDDMASTGVISAAALLSVAFCSVAVAVLVRRRQNARKPEDMARLQEDLRKELGLSVIMSFGEGSLGVSISLQAEGQEDILIDTERLSKMVHHHMGVLFSRLPGKPMVDEVQLDATSNSALVVLSPQPGLNKPLEPEKIVSSLDKSLRKNPVELHSGNDDFVYTAVSAAQALPRRVPKEISVRNVERLEKLGEGNFAEVYRGQVDERDRHLPPYPVAVKVLKGGLDPEIRKSFLREAALMAMLEHPRIVLLVGICTVPVDMPPLLLMQYCDRGSLELYLHGLEAEVQAERDLYEAEGIEWGDEEEEKWRLDDTVKLTFAADVCHGLQYLATCRIIHRDIAARNVLLDAAYICRVADFGQSQALSDSKDYVRLFEQTAVRWAAREVLEEDKFSAASDVWSFGILLHEIMSMAEIPYKDLANNTKVIDFVTKGGIMERHRLCAPTVYNQLILPCWRQNPAERIGYDELLELLQQLGGTAESSGFTEESEERLVYDDGEVDERHVMSLDERLLLGPSVYHLNGTLRHKLESIVRDHPQSLESCLPSDLEDLRIWQMVQIYTKPVGRKVRCPRDFMVGAAYVDTLKGRDNVGRATALLSYSWGNKIFDICDALSQWVDVNAMLPKRTYIWICSLCLNQHRIVKVLTPEELSREFAPRVTAIGRIIPFMDPWNDPAYITRAWCLFEMFTAISLGAKQCNIDVTLSPKEETRFKEAMVEGGYSKFDKVLSGLSSRNAEASEQADLDAITKLIQAVPGNFSKIDATVKAHLRKWAADYSGAVATNVRMDIVNRRRGTADVRTSSSGTTRSGGATTSADSSDTRRTSSDFERYAGRRTRRSMIPGFATEHFYRRSEANNAHASNSSVILPSPLKHSTVESYDDFFFSMEETDLVPEIGDLQRDMKMVRYRLNKNKIHLRTLRSGDVAQHSRPAAFTVEPEHVLSVHSTLSVQSDTDASLKKMRTKSQGFAHLAAKPALPPVIRQRSDRPQSPRDAGVPVGRSDMSHGSHFRPERRGFRPDSKSSARPGSRQREVLPLSPSSATPTVLIGGRPMTPASMSPRSPVASPVNGDGHRSLPPIRRPDRSQGRKKKDA